MHPLFKGYGGDDKTWIGEPGSDFMVQIKTDNENL